jgi:hypothetical protein
MQRYNKGAEGQTQTQAELRPQEAHLDAHKLIQAQYITQWSRVLRSGGLNHSKPLCILVFSPFFQLTGKTLRPLLVLGFRAGAFRHPAGEFPLRHLACQVWCKSWSTTPRLRQISWWKKPPLPRHRFPTAQCLALLLCTLHDSIRLRRHPGLRRGQLRGHCLQPWSCCVTLQAPRPHWGP